MCGKIKRVNFSSVLYDNENVIKKNELSAIFNEDVINLSEVKRLIYSEQYASSQKIIVVSRLQADILFGKSNCTSTLIRIGN